MPLPSSTRRASISLFVALALGFVSPIRARAQVNTDPLRAGPPPREGLSGSLDVSITRLGGNVDLLDLGLGGRMQTTTYFALRPVDSPEAPYVRDLVLLMGNIRNAARAGDTYLNQGLLHARFMRMWHRRVGSTLFLQHQFNEFQRLRVRSIWGASVSLQVVHLPRFNLTYGTGYMFEYNRIAVFPGADDPPQTFEHRWSNFLGARLTAMDGRLQAQSATYFQPRFDRISDIRFLEELELMVKANDMLAIGATLGVLVDTAPPTGVQPTDTRIASNVRFSF